jgi:hypothetical protein
MRRAIAGTILAAWLCYQVHAQSATDAKPAEAKLEFEVASIKPSALPGRGVNGVIRLGLQGGPGSGDPGRVTYTFSTIRDLMVDAYSVKRYQVSGVRNGWIPNNLTSWPRSPRAPRRNKSRSCCKTSWRSVSSSRCIAKPKSCRCTRWWWAPKVPS